VATMFVNVRVHASDAQSDMCLALPSRRTGHVSLDIVSECRHDYRHFLELWETVEVGNPACRA
jgi:hypothetical protein